MLCSGQSSGPARCITLALVLCAAMPRLNAAISLPESVVTYDEAVHWPRIRVDGMEKAASHTCRVLSTGEISEVFSNLPITPSLSYQSLSFSATRTSMLGNLVELAGTPRVADRVEAILITWAKAADYPAWAAEDPIGFTHPLTVRLYQLDTTGSSTTLRELEALKLQVHIPWRPITMADGSPYPYNGYAFKVVLPLSGQIAVSNSIIIALSYDTQFSGLNPTGYPGPFNELNVGLSGLKPRVGTDPDNNSVFWVKDGQWSYPATNWGGVGSPMLNLFARNVPLPSPVLRNDAPPRHAGLYHVQSTLGDGTLIDSVQAISKARAGITASDTGKSIADADRYPSVSTTPSGLPFTITYGGSSELPTTPGIHSYRITVDSADYEGSASGQLHLSAPRYEQWAAQAFPGVLPPAAERTEDPDHDGTSNLLEYALGLNPLARDVPGSFLSHTSEVTFTYRVRKEMPELLLHCEASEDLKQWKTVESQIVNDDGFWENREILSEKERRFFRLKASTK